MFLKLKYLLNSGLGKSIGVVLSGNILSSIFGFLGSLIILRNFSTEGIGILYPAIGVMMIFAQFGDLGLSTGLIKVASSSKSIEDKKAVFFSILIPKLVLAIIFSGCCFFLASYISKVVFGDIRNAYVLQVISIGLFFQILIPYFNSINQVLGNFRVLSVSKWAPSLIKLLGLFYLFRINKMELLSILILTVIVPVLNVFIAFLFTHKYCLSLAKDYRKYLGKVWLVARWVGLTSIINVLISQVDVLILRSLSGEEEVQRLMGGLKLSSPFSLVTMSLMTVVLPKVSSMVSKDELRFFFRKAKLILPVISLILVIFLPLSYWLIPAVLGERHADSVIIFQTYLIAFLLSLYISPLSTILYRVNKEHYFVGINLSQLFLNLGLNFLLIPYYGALGASVATLAVNLFGFVLIYFIVRGSLYGK